MQQLVEVHPGTTEDRIEPVTFNQFETVAVHAVLSFRVPDSRFDGSASFHPAPQAPGSSPPAAFVDMNLYLSSVCVAAVAHVHNSMLRAAAGNPLDLIQGIFESMTVLRVIVHGHGPYRPTATAGGRHADLAAKLVALVCFAFTDTLHLRFMNAVNFVFIVTLLRKNPL